VGVVLARQVSADETVVMPAPSAFSLAAGRLGWAVPGTVLLSLHGRALGLLRPPLHPRAHLFALPSHGDQTPPVARLLVESGFGASRLTVLEALGGPRERIRTTSAAEFDLIDIDPLNTVAIVVKARPGARVIGRSCGLDDALFEHDGQITKREIRA